MASVVYQIMECDLKIRLAVLVLCIYYWKSMLAINFDKDYFLVVQWCVLYFSFLTITLLLLSIVVNLLTIMLNSDNNSKILS